jgi:hypothetical protein
MKAVTVATTMDYDWKFAKIDVTQGALLQWKGEIVERNERTENQDLNAQQAPATVVVQISANHR